MEQSVVGMSILPEGLIGEQDGSQPGLPFPYRRVLVQEIGQRPGLLLSIPFRQ